MIVSESVSIRCSKKCRFGGFISGAEGAARLRAYLGCALAVADLFYKWRRRTVCILVRLSRREHSVGEMKCRRG